MKYIAIIVLVLIGLVEFPIRVAMLAAFTVCTLFAGLIILEDDLQDLITPVSLKLAEQLARECK